MDDFEVYIAQDGQTYRYLINNANFESFIKVVKVDAETGVTIPYAGAGFQIYRPDGSKVEMTFTYPTRPPLIRSTPIPRATLLPRKSWSMVRDIPWLRYRPPTAMCWTVPRFTLM